MATPAEATPPPVSRTVGHIREPYADYAFLTVEEVQAMLGRLGVKVALYTIRRMVREGRLARFPGRLKPAGRKSRWRVLILRRSVDAWIHDMYWEGTWDRYHRKNGRLRVP